MQKVFLIIMMPLFLCSCSVFAPDKDITALSLPSQFSLYNEKDEKNVVWWNEFGSSELDLLIEAAIAENFTVRESWARLQQARYAAIKTGSSLFPELSYGIGAAEYKTKNSGTSSVSSEEWNLGFSMSFEIDLWGRIQAERESSSLLAQSSAEDLKTAVISVTGQIAENWVSLISTRNQIDLFTKQIHLQKQLLDLIKKRFPMGRSTALDIYQQQQAIEKIEAALIPLQNESDTFRRQIALLTGKSSLPQETLLQSTFPIIKETPAVGLPADLLAARPDVRSAGLKLKSAEWEIAAAKADRLPAVKLTASHTYRSEEIGNVFDNWLLNLAGNLTGPVFDGRKRRIEVERIGAVADERLASYGKIVFSAIKEVEDALSDEEQFRKTVATLDRQLDLSERTMREARRRYLNGNSDFLNVLREELNSIQLQQETIVAREKMLLARIKLHKALGGSWLGQISYFDQDQEAASLKLKN